MLLQSVGAEISVSVIPHNDHGVYQESPPAKGRTSHQSLPKAMNISIDSPALSFEPPGWQYLLFPAQPQERCKRRKRQGLTPFIDPIYT